MGLGPYFGRILGQSVGVLNGDKWKTTRRTFDPHLSYQVAMQYQATFTREVVTWMEDLPLAGQKKESAEKISGFTVDATTACRILPFKMVASVLYGDALSDATFGELLALNALHEKVMFGTFFGKQERSRIFTLLPSQAKSRMDEFEAQWRAFNLAMIENSQKVGPARSDSISANAVL